ncbi:MAG: hypothetical protein A2447_03650 [Omnitrophica WOR_2 bacterium RIFOXYC2_FULL_38_12]|nr:MAG: hypothetical protein A2447_03650 [Omnitrophica WOR_2 bacterium RIFOXYC2_FULL_38_12]
MTLKQKISIILLLTAVTILPHVSKANVRVDQGLQLADQLREEKSFRIALGHYEELLKQEGLSKEITRELKFKYADCSLRTQEASRYEDAVASLKGLIESEDHDQWWAEASESLAEHYILVDQWQYQQQIKEYLSNAREYWAGSKDIEVARKRFIKATFTLGDYLSQNYGWYFQDVKSVRELGGEKVDPGQPANNGLFVIYEDILKIVKSDEDKAKVYYSLAMSYLNQYYVQEKKDLAVEYFNKVIEETPSSEWADDSYYYLANYYEQKQDYKNALKSYQDLLARFGRGQSRWVDDAKRRMEDITSPQIGLSNNFTYLPGSQIQFSMNWRNISVAQFNIYKIDLVEEMSFDLTKPETDYYRGVENYSTLIKRIVDSGKYSSLPKVMSWQRRMKNEGNYMQHSAINGLAQWQVEDDSEEQNEDIDLDKGTLEPGAYLLLVTASGKTAYDLIFVTEMGLVTKTGGHSALFYAFNSDTGVPKQEAKIKFQYRYYDDSGNWRWAQGEGFTDTNGLLKSQLLTSNNRYNDQHQIFAVVSDGQMQAFSQGNYYSYGGASEQWRLYAYSDRPAYRPDEEVSFKAALRSYDEDSFHTPSNKPVQVRVLDPRGNKVFEKLYVLNDFGSLNDKFILDEKATLGEYRIEIYSQDFNDHLGQTTLFRLEEYKLPEFLVTIKPKAKDDEGPSTYQLGDVIDIEVDAQYYFGGAVADAEVEYLVYQQNYAHYYRKPVEYPWYYEDMYNPYNHYYDNGQLITKEKIKTDFEGKAFFSIETPENLNQDLKYRIEVRIVDQSRREITATSEIKVTRFPFYAYLNPKQNLYRPGDKAEVDIKTITANDEPVAAEGKITVSRNWWKDSVVQDGKMLKEAAYDKSELFTKFIKTDIKGEAVFSFEPEQDGYYEVSFVGFDSKGKEIRSQTNVFVCADQSKDLGYRYGGVQIIAEKDTYGIGETARVMLVANNPDTWILLSVEADEIFDYNMYHLDGTVKLVEIPIAENFTPNIFINALSPEKHQLKLYNLPVVVPPDEKFLNVKIVSDKEVYRPQEEGVFDIEITDKNGEPVAGEVSLGIVDSSVYYIQSEYAQDIRQFFYGQKRYQSVQTQSSFNYRQYKRLVLDEQNKIIDEIAYDQRRKGVKNNLPEESKQVQPMIAQFGGADMLMEDAEMEGMALGSSTMVSDSAPMKASRMVSKEKKSESDKKDSDESGMLQGGGQGGELKEATVRKDFRSTVLWQPTINTNAEGKAVVKVKFPDSLTTWRATARSLTKDTSVGNVTHDTRTKKDVIVRLQSPRFFTERDEVTISANVHNYTDSELEIKVSIDAKGLDIQEDEPLWVNVEPEGERRIDWKATALEKGIAKITVSAQSKEDSDAMVRSYSVIPHGIEKFIAESVVAKSLPEQQISKEFTLDVPRERIEESTELQITLSPSLASAMLDALPYLADYPYGCVEQTMSRFLPAVIVKKTMRDLGLKQNEIDAYLSDVLAPRNDPAHPERNREETLSKLDKMTKAGLDRLYDFQHSDGGWGWWKEGDSDNFMTAYVVWGLSLAKDAGIDLKSDVLQRAVNYLQNELVEREDDPDMLAWMLHALGKANSRSQFEDKQIARLWEMREGLNPYTRALFALSQYYRDDVDRAIVLARNMANGIEEDKENGTVHWGESGIHYRWSEGGVEATAFAIKALVNILPESEYIEPAVKWMALNRRGARWKNTRDTAIAILGLADYLRATEELVPDFDYSVLVNGEVAQQGHVDQANVFSFNRIVNLNNEVIRDGNNKVEIVVKGKGSLYVSGYLKYFTLEENITPEGNEVFVEREYFIEDTAETLLKGYDIDWKPLKSGDHVNSGDRIKVEITLDSKNHYEYLVVEDYKPAGLEAVELKSGSGYADQLDSKDRVTNSKTWLYQEYRDQKAVMFIDKLKQGKHRISYELRAEIPGTFHGMPNQTHAMYVPEVRANSSEMIISVDE